jgi:succinoglycan biosynthesis protein ExoM
VRATVCIATHRRRRGLERLLASLVAQENSPSFDVVIVDNDREKSAEPVALAFRDKLPLTYLVEPVRGIARSRNRAVAASRSPSLAFIDDDEWATPQWLAALEHESERSTADVVIGRVEVVFDLDVPELVRRCGLFDPSPLPDGAIVPWYMTRTSNAYVRRDALPDRDTPFSTRYDLIGGEDVQLFGRMIASGRRVVASTTALVFEHRPIRRANIRWVFRRALRNGGSIVDCEWTAMAPLSRLRRGLQCGWLGARKLARARADWRRDGNAGRHLVDGGQEIGKLLRVFGIRIVEYRHHT